MRNAHAAVYGACHGAGKHQARMRANNRDGRQSNRIGLEQGVNLLVKPRRRGFVKGASTRWRPGHCYSSGPLRHQACEKRVFSPFPVRQDPKFREQRQELVVAQTELPAAWMIEALMVIDQECFIDDDAAWSQ